MTPLERQLANRSPGAMLEQRRGRVAALRDALQRRAADLVPRRRLRIGALADATFAAARRNVTRDRADLMTQNAASSRRITRTRCCSGGTRL